MKKNSVKTEVWRLILLPAISITLLLSGTLTLLYINKQSDLIHTRGQLLAEKTAHLAHLALQEHQDAMLAQIIETSLEEPLIRAVHVYDARRDQSYHSGPRFLPAHQDEASTAEGIRTARTDDSLRFRHPIVSNADQTPIGWLEIELMLTPYRVTVYQILLIAALATAACLALAGFLAVRLHGKIVRPLRRVRTVIHRLNDGHLGSRVTGHFAYEFDQLAESINHLARHQEQAQQDMQLHIDQSMDDLKETLETIEVQNIELDMARKEALAASRIKSEFLANTSHEIRTPLNGIIGFTNLALKTQLDEKQRGYVQTIHDSAQSLMTTINDILDFSKIESGKLVLDYVPLPLRQVVDGCVESQSHEAVEKNLQIVTVIDNAIPPQLMGDPERLKQVLANLLGNAIKFSRRGTITIDIQLENFGENQLTLRVAVRDEGIGLSREQQAGLFSAFAQADTSSSREHGGTGLGLAICKGLVERMGGEIGVKSEPDQGATFWFTAKLGVDPNYAAPEQNCLRGRQILICSESEPGYRQLQSLTESWQAQTSWIHSIHDIFPTLRDAQSSDQNYGLMILDVAPDERKLPPALLSNLAEQLNWEFNCKVIVCCMPSHRELFAQHTHNQALAFVTKPVTYDQLLDAISASLGVSFHGGPELPAQTTSPPKAVLLVDDNPSNLQLTSELLRDLNVTVAQAASGEAAIEQFRQQRFDLVLMDIQMPDMDGMETTRRLREMDSETRTPVVALTAHSMTEHKTDLLIAGLDDCIRKPVTEAQLGHMLDRWTGLKNTADRLGPPQPRFDAEDDERGEGDSPVNITQSLSLANQKKGLARDMLSMLIRGLPDERAAINDAYQREDLDDMQDRVHKLYGSACYTGVPHLRSLSGLLDKILQSGQTQNLESTLQSMNSAIETLLAWAEGRDLDRLFGDAER